jgi:iron-sulfur cluster repair protein YtfE (RIC family)
MAARIDQEKGHTGRLILLISRLHDLLFRHLHREDRVLLAIASDQLSPELAQCAARLHQEHVVVLELLDELRAELGGDFRVPATASATARMLGAELTDLEEHLRTQIALEDSLLASTTNSLTTHERSLRALALRSGHDDRTPEV